MILRYESLAARPGVFASMTGVRLPTFVELADDVVPRLRKARMERRQRPGRQRAPGGGHPFELTAIDAVLLTVVWLRHYPTGEVLGYFFGVSKATAGRMIAEVLPLLEAAGRDTMRLPDPGRYQRRALPEVLQRVPELADLLARPDAVPTHSPAPTRPESVPAVLVDSFEQPVQRPRRRAEADRWYSGKKRLHTIKTQVALCEASGRLVDVYGGAVGPFSDLTLLSASGLPRRLPPAVPLIGDGAYLGMAEFRPDGGTCLVPRRNHARRRLTDEDRAYNRWLAGRRVRVEHGIHRLRVFECLSRRDRHHRRGHERRVIAVAGLVNRQLGPAAA